MLNSHEQGACSGGREYSAFSLIGILVGCHCHAWHSSSQQANEFQPEPRLLELIQRVMTHCDVQTHLSSSSLHRHNLYMLGQEWILCHLRGHSHRTLIYVLIFSWCLHRQRTLCQSWPLPSSATLKSCPSTVSWKSKCLYSLKTNLKGQCIYMIKKWSVLIQAGFRDKN